MRTIGLEEHFVTPELAAYGAGTATLAQPHVWEQASRRLLDLTGERVELMDAAGLDVQVLSLNSPGIQAEPDAAVAVSRASPPCRCRIPRPRPRSWSGRSLSSA